MRLNQKAFGDGVIRVLSKSLLWLLLIGPTTELLAATFTVDSLGDFSDANLSDGLCATLVSVNPPQFACSVRGAIEQANSTAGDDTIEFSVAGRITVSAALGPLPIIATRITIDGASAPGAPTRDGDSPQAPVIVIDGADLVSPTDSLIGLEFAPGAQQSRLINVAVVNIPGDAVWIHTHLIWVTGSWLGLDPITGLAAANANGLRVDADQANIGHTIAGSGRGNVISGNRNLAINAFATNFSVIRGNRIGVDAAATGVIANLGGGIRIEGDNNDIGGLIGLDVRRNVVSGNRDFNIQVRGNANFVRGNLIGCGINTALANDQEGLRLIGGDGLRVGGTDADAGNRFCRHPRNGILLGPLALGGSPVTDSEVIGNAFEGNQIGILVIRSNTVTVTNNVFDNNSFAAIALTDTTDSHVDDNLVQGGGRGISLLRASRNSIQANQLALVFSFGVFLREDSNSNVVAFNQVGGVLGLAGASAEGIRVSASSDNQIFDNVLAMNGGAGIGVVLASLGNEISRNAMMDNLGGGIDLGQSGSADGPSLNDSGDADEGPNRFQNYPELSLIDFFPGMGGVPVVAPQLDISVTVDSASTHSDYPLTIDFYLSGETNPDQGELWLQSLSYSTPQSAATVTVGLPLGTTAGLVLATASDASGNTSEFSAALAFGLPDEVFRDSFEDF